MYYRKRRYENRYITFVFFLVLTPFLMAHITEPSFAAGTGLPWEEPLAEILESIQGPVAQFAAVAAIVFTGLALAFGESSGTLRRALQIILGLSIAFAASTFFLDFFGFTGGAVIG